VRVFRITFLLTVLVSLFAAVAWTWLLRPGSKRDNAAVVIVASGRIEGRETTLAPKAQIQGRIKTLLVNEGDAVKKDQLLAEIESDQLNARYQNATDTASVLQTQVEQASLDLELTIKNTAARIAAAEAEVSVAQAQLRRAKSVQNNAKLNYERYATLSEEQVVAKSDFDQKRLEFETAAADVNAAEKQANKAEADLALATAAKDTIKIKTKQLNQAQNNYKAALANLEEATANLRDMKIYSPSDGTILSRPVEIGEVVGAGTPMYVMVDMNRLYLKVYIPETDIGKLKLGNEARVYVDAYPGRAFDAHVTKIYQQAEFTPKNVETREERVKLVFGIELSLDNPEAIIKPGMPADGTIRWKEDAPWPPMK